jgi:hypothetical protein
MRVISLNSRNSTNPVKHETLNIGTLRHGARNIGTLNIGTLRHGARNIGARNIWELRR